jgi:ABC-type molybdate transport system substrate-binding protein
LNDLTRPGLRVGLPDHEKSAMGNIAWKLLQTVGLYDRLGQNLKVESPTGDLLVNQLRTGSLDAIIACRSHYATTKDCLEAVAIDHPLARLEQTIAVGRASHFPRLAGRLLEALMRPASRQRFEAAGFGWRYQPDSVQ